MPKVTIEFDLPEEQEEYDIYSKATSLHACLWDLKQDLRNTRKYLELSVEEDRIYEEIQDKLWSSIEDFEITHLM